MTGPSRWLQRVRSRLADRGRFERDLADEVRAHLELRVTDLIRRGLTPNEARRRATLEFGGIERYKERVRDTLGWTRLPAQLTRETRVALRRLRASPLSTTFSIVTLALGIGVTTAVYSVLRYAVAPPLGIRDDESVVSVYDRDRIAALSGPDYRDLVSQQRAFQALGARATVVTSVGDETSSTLADGEMVSGSYFDILGVRPVRGRLLGPADDRPDAPALVVLSERTWRRRFQADPSIVGTSVLIGQHPFVVVGIAAGEFRGLDGIGRNPQFWVALAHAERFAGSFLSSADFDQRNRRLLRVVGRLRPEAAAVQASSELHLIGTRLDEQFPIPRDGRVGAPQLKRLWTAGQVRPAVRAPEASAGRLIIALPAVVFLIACTNLANLALSRGISRRGDIAVRRALGASRTRLVREEMTEPALISLAGGLLGVGVAKGLLALGTTLISPYLSVLAPTMVPEPGLDLAVLAAAGIATLLSLVVGGLAPSLHLARTSLRQSLAGGSIQAVPRWRGRGNLIALQVGASVGLFLVAFAATEALSTAQLHAGPRFDHMAVASIPFRHQQYPEARAQEILDRITLTLRRSPGVGAIAVVAGPGFGLRSLPSSYTRASASPIEPASPGTPATDAALTIGSPDIFQILGLPILEGRTFTDADTHGSERVAVINEDLALTLFGTTHATGRTFLANIRSPWIQTDEQVTTRVVGIVPVRIKNRRGVRHAELYVPFAQHYDWNPVVLAVAGAGQAPPVAPLRAAIRAVEPSLATAFIGTGTTLTDTPAILLGAVILVANGLAAFALILAMAGLFGVLSDVVTRRRREMALRLALGAGAGRVTRLVLRDGLRPVAEGLAIGLGSAMVIRQFLRATQAPDMAAIDLVAFSSAGVLLFVAGLIACVVPARRAANVAPGEALREL
jgi:predicted permease